MTEVYAFKRHAAVVLAVLCLGLQPFSLLANGQVDEPAAVESTVLESGLPWQEVYFETSRRWASASSRIRMYEIASDQLEEAWLQPADNDNTGALRPRGPVIYGLIAESEVVRNREMISLWLDPEHWGGYQRCRVSHGRSNSRAHCHRYYEGNIYRERRQGPRSAANAGSESDWAAGGPESAAVLAEGWEISSHFRLQLPDGIPADTAFVSPQALLALAAVAPLAEVGDRHQTYVHTDHDFYQVTLSVSGTERSSVRYYLRTRSADGGPESSRRVTGEIEALVIAIEANPLAPQEESFEFFGLRAPITVLLHPQTRLPLEIRGNAPRLGASAISLSAARVIEAAVD